MLTCVSQLRKMDCFKVEDEIVFPAFQDEEQNVILW
jgi:hypothetical protein